MRYMSLKINNTNIAEHIQESTYKVNQEDVFEEWLDGNYKTHHQKTRTKIQGSFEMAFVTLTEYNSFLSLIKNNTATDSTVPMQIYVTNINEEKTINAFVKVTSTKMREISSAYTLFMVDVEVEEQ